MEVQELEKLIEQAEKDLVNSNKQIDQELKTIIKESSELHDKPDFNKYYYLNNPRTEPTPRGVPKDSPAGQKITNELSAKNQNLEKLDKINQIKPFLKQNPSQDFQIEKPPAGLGKATAALDSILKYFSESKTGKANFKFHRPEHDLESMGEEERKHHAMLERTL